MINNLLYEIEDLLRYYKIRINPSELESMIEPNVAINYINRLKFELPFGRIDIEEYLKNKENELKEMLKQEKSEKSMTSDFL